jgi:hypothetical protein
LNIVRDLARAAYVNHRRAGGISNSCRGASLDEYTAATPIRRENRKKNARSITYAQLMHISGAAFKCVQ